MNYADEYYQIGIQHLSEAKPCQDHAMTNADEYSAYFSLSDGCSEGGKTDIGARLMNLANMKALKKIAETSDDSMGQEEIVTYVYNERLRLLKNIQEILAIENKDLLATSIYGYLGSNIGFVHVVGDGVVAGVSQKGTDIWRYTWADNTPYYPAYDMGLKEQFVIAHGGDFLVERLTEEQWQIDLQGVATLIATRRISLGQALGGVTIDFSSFIKARAPLKIVAFSDGIELVDGIGWIDAVKESLSYKNLKGSFVKRRMKRFIKDVSKEHRGPLDDISSAAIYYEP